MKIQNEVTIYLLEEKAKINGNKPYIYFEDRIISYQDLFELTCALANGWSDLGIKKGDRVLLLLDNCPEYVFNWMSLTHLGALEVPINTAFKGRMLKHIINDSGARYILVENNYLNNIKNIEEELFNLEKIVVFSELEYDESSIPEFKHEILPYNILQSKNKHISPIEIRHYDLMAIFYTSGTTGPSKGVLMTFRHAYRYSMGHIDCEVVQAGRCHYCCTPLFHVGGQLFDCYAAFIANTSVAIARNFSASNFLNDVRKYNCGSTMLVGATNYFLNSQPEEDDNAQNPLKVVNQVPVLAQKEDFEKRFGLKIHTVYGSTEAGLPIFTKEPKGLGICGKPREGYEIRIVDEFDEELPSGKPGEMIIRHRDPWKLMVGYLNVPEKNEEAWRNLWFHSGDMLYKDEEGNLYFIDRIKDAIRRRGENISSYEVEEEIIAHPDVVESSVVAVCSEYSEDEVKAVVVLRKDSKLTPEELIKFLEPRMPYYMIPRFVEFKNELPRTANQKSKKDVLRSEGVTNSVWDREKAGIKISR